MKPKKYATFIYVLIMGTWTVLTFLQSHNLLRNTNSHSIIPAFDRIVFVPYFYSHKDVDPIQASIDLHNRRLQEEKQAAVAASEVITTALCHKTLFGSIDIHKIVQWAAYHKLLGFDHIFIWYLPILAVATENSTVVGNWSELEQLPYVTLLENSLGQIQVTDSNYTRIHKGKPGGQYDNEKWCLQDKAKDYDFVLMADGDEFLWFNRRIGLKEFLEPYKNFTYLSFGKYMYTLRQGVKSSRNTFGLDQFPFTAKSYCYARNARRGHAYCPAWPGRSKVLVNPAAHPNVNVHGTIGKRKEFNTTHEIHFPTNQAHLKEWAGWTSKHNIDTEFQRPPYSTMDVPVADTPGFHELERAHKEIPGKEGYRRLYYDHGLIEWFEFVAGLAGRSSRSS